MLVKQFDDHKINKLENRSYIQKISDKPSGFWVTNDNEYNWKQFCEAEDFRLDKLKFENIFKISNDANILIINTLEDFDDFGKKYKVDNYHIDWITISKLFDGIFISEYFWERRLSEFWYYGWDCASGCIWNLNVMNVVEEVI